jgi:hypothetical protein
MHKVAVMTASTLMPEGHRAGSRVPDPSSDTGVQRRRSERKRPDRLVELGAKGGVLVVTQSSLLAIAVARSIGPRWSGDPDGQNGGSHKRYTVLEARTTASAPAVGIAWDELQG